ncbi:MAG: M56 family metallopeptidase [Gemmatimonadota bacterium]
MSAEFLASALAHSLWQGAAIAGLAAAILALPSWGPSRRARALMTALIGVPMVTLGTGALIGGAGVFGPVPGPASGPGKGSGLAKALETGVAALDAGTVEIAGWVVAVWAAGAALLGARLLAGLYGARRLGADAERPAAHVRVAVERAADLLRLRRPPEILQTDRIDSPAALGGRRPRVLVPRGIEDRLSRRDVQVLMAHEVAHLARGDWKAGIAQAAVEALFWFHPGVWWLSARLRREREFACDDLAARVAGGSLHMARALERLESLRARPIPVPAMPVARGPLLARVRRLVDSGPPRDRRGLGGPVAAGRVALGLAGAALAAWATVVAVPVAAAAASGVLSTVRAVDDAGTFTITFRDGRAVGGSLDGLAIGPERLRQTPDSLYFLAPDGSTSFGVRVRPDGGISWNNRSAATAPES